MTIRNIFLKYRQRMLSFNVEIKCHDIYSEEKKTLADKIKIE
jgi:hypothetical protein